MFPLLSMRFITRCGMLVVCRVLSVVWLTKLWAVGLSVMAYVRFVLKGAAALLTLRLQRPTLVLRCSALCVLRFVGMMLCVCSVL